MCGKFVEVVLAPVGEQELDVAFGGSATLLAGQGLGDRVGSAGSAALGDVLVEQHDEWAEGRRYLGLDVLAKSQAVDTHIEEVPDDLTLQAITA